MSFLHMTRDSGPRPVPTCLGDPALAWHLIESLVLNDEIDVTMVEGNVGGSRSDRSRSRCYLVSRSSGPAV